MAACDTQALIDANPCLVELSDHQLNVLIAQMLCNLKNYFDSGGTLTCDIQELLDEGSCFEMLDDFRLKVVTAQLLCDISNLV